MTAITDTNNIEAMRLLTLRKMLQLEIKGMARRGRSAYAILKGMGYTGSRATVLAKLDEDREKILAAAGEAGV